MIEEQEQRSLEDLAQSANDSHETAEARFGAAGVPGTLGDFVQRTADLAEARHHLKTALEAVERASTDPANDSIGGELESIRGPLKDAAARLSAADDELEAAMRAAGMTRPAE